MTAECTAGTIAVVKIPDSAPAQQARPQQRRQNWSNALAGSAILALLGFGYWLFQAPGLAGEPLAPQATRDTATIHSPSPPRADGHAPWRGTVMRSGDADTEVCGLGRFATDVDGEEARLAQAPAIAQAKEANVQALLRSADVATKAAGMVLRIAEVRLKAQAEAAVPWVERLAALVRDAVSPAVYAQAVHACTGHPGLPACSTVSAERWTRLEPGNLTPWSLLLNQARARKDTAAVNEALHQMSLAQYASGYDLFAWSKLAADSAPPVSDLQQLVSLEQGLSLFVLPSDHASGLRIECSKAAVLDANRRQLCEKIANVLVDRSDTLVAATVGTAIGRASGWPWTRVAAVRAQRRAIQQTYQDWSKADRTPDGQSKMDCAAVENHRSYIRTVGELGESAALRALSDAKGHRVQRLTQAYFPEEMRRLEQEIPSARP